MAKEGHCIVAGLVTSVLFGCAHGMALGCHDMSTKESSIVLTLYARGVAKEGHDVEGC